jgi:hypothetical protein
MPSAPEKTLKRKSEEWSLTTSACRAKVYPPKAPRYNEYRKMEAKTIITTTTAP